MSRKSAAVLAVTLAACANQEVMPRPPKPAPWEASNSWAAADLDIKYTLGKQAEGWNRGDLGAYMDGYERSDTVIFTSGGRITRGWQAIHDYFASHYTQPSEMGRVTLDAIETTLTGDGAALVFGRWRLDYPKAKSVGGRFTLGMRKGPLGWRVFHDHTSVEKPAD